MTHQYDTKYWRSEDGRLLLQARRLLTAILAISQSDPTLPAPHMAPLIDYYRSTKWQGFFATWYASNGDTLSIYARNDALEIWAEDSQENTVFRYGFSNEAAGQGPVGYPYRRYRADRLALAIGQAQRWCAAHRNQLGSIQDSIERLFFNGPALPQETSWEEEWGGYNQQDKFWEIRRLFCLAQACVRANTEMPFFTFTGYSYDDQNLQFLHDLSLEWLTGQVKDEPYRNASIEIFADKDFMFYASSAMGDQKLHTEISSVFGTTDPEAEPLTRENLHEAINGFRDQLKTLFPERTPDSQFFYECGLNYNADIDDWENFFPRPPKTDLTVPVPQRAETPTR